MLTFGRGGTGCWLDVGGARTTPEVSSGLRTHGGGPSSGREKVSGALRGLRILQRHLRVSSVGLTSTWLTCWMEDFRYKEAVSWQYSAPSRSISNLNRLDLCSKERQPSRNTWKVIALSSDQNVRIGIAFFLKDDLSCS